MTSAHQSWKSLPVSLNSTGFYWVFLFVWGVFLFLFLVLIQALALFFSRTSIKPLLFPGSRLKSLACFDQLFLQLWASLPGCLLLRGVNTVLLSFLNKLLQPFPLSSHPISKFLLVEDSSQAPPGSSHFLLFPSHLHTNSVCLCSCCEIFIHDTL